MTRPNTMRLAGAVHQAGIKPTETAPAEIIADSVVAIAEGIRKLRAGRLNDRAIVLLINDVCGVAKRDIKLVLDSITSLDSTFLKKTRP